MKSSLFFALATLLAGCEVDPYCFGNCDTGGDADTDTDTDADTDADSDADGDAGPDAGDSGPDLPDGCTPGAAELCNGVDDNCVGGIDEGYDLDTDVRNCGACGHDCLEEVAHAFSHCEAAACVFDDCDIGWYDLDGDTSNGCEYSCLAVPAPDDSVCNARDDDCDGEVDEEVDMDSDPNNCGACGFRCTPVHGTGSCVGGDCEVGACDADFWDVDGEFVNGCEYSCTFTSDDETCNLFDDDCDGDVDAADGAGVVDDGGGCGSDVGACTAGNETCVGGSLVCPDDVEPTAELCNGADDDCDGSSDEGNPEGGAVCGTDQGECVAGRMTCVGGALVCVGSVGAVAETCNAKDDDCDGSIDEGDPDSGANCGTDTGECSFGTRHCVGGVLVCQGGTGPVLEICNSRDDDCDGVDDEGFDLDDDLDNCGACGNECDIPNAFEICNAGSCEIFACETGFVDDPLVAGVDCGYECDFNGSEVCNGLDDDCDRSVDEGIVAPANFCNPNGACAGTAATCDGVDGWQCNYGADVQTDAGGNIVPETRCDGKDNDCDGLVDEQDPLKGSTCSNGTGECERFGNYVCDVDDDEAPVVCNAPPEGDEAPETCNGLDDDCDGTNDNGVVEDMLQIDRPAGTPDIWMFRYEASRPDATDLDAGTDGTLACSKTDVMPWTDVTWDEADEACAALDDSAGVPMRLCSEAEWTDACQSISNACVWSYDGTPACNAYSAATCNGNDYDCDGVAAGNQDCLLATESLGSCGSDWLAGAGISRVWDLSGNAKEWTSTNPAGGGVEYRLMGGSYNNPQGGLTCTFNFTVAPPDFHFPNVGFRCCSDNAP